MVLSKVNQAFGLYMKTLHKVVDADNDRQSCVTESRRSLNQSLEEDSSSASSWSQPLSLLMLPAKNQNAAETQLPLRKSSFLLTTAGDDEKEEDNKSSLLMDNTRNINSTTIRDPQTNSDSSKRRKIMTYNNTAAQYIVPVKTNLFNGLYINDKQQRLQSADRLIQQIGQWIEYLHEYGVRHDEMMTKVAQHPQNEIFGGSDGVYSRNPNAIADQANHGEHQADDSQSQTDLEELASIRQKLRYHIMVLLRMSTNCPFAEVRQIFTQYIAHLRECGLIIPKPVHNSPSFFIPESKLVPLDVNNTIQRDIMEQAFLTNGRLSNVYRVLVYFPDYLEKFMASFNQILRLQGPLPRSWRNYIAIMAASQHQCQYLIQLQINEFLHNGGDPLWLNGLKSAPQKLQDLAELNTLMAHQPWRIKKDHITALTKGNDAWSKSELVLAIVVMAKFQGLSSFVLGCGIVPDYDLLGGSMENLGASSSSSQLADGMNEDFNADVTGLRSNRMISGINNNNNIDDAQDQSQTVQHTTQLMQRLTSKSSFDNDIDDSNDNNKNKDNTAGRENIQQDIPSEKRAEVFANLEEQDTFTMDMSAKQSPVVDGEDALNAILLQEDYERFLGDKELKHVDFDVKSSEYSIFRLQDYNWEEHGVSLITKYLPELGDMLDAEFNAILNLTDYSLNNSRDELENVDTWPFRQAVWYYVLRLGGMCHDDFNYHQVNIYLNKRIKQYIKKVACYPESIVPSDFHKMGFSFRYDEKVHINLLASEARQCCNLLYALIKMEK
ncbi:hypothetical protein MP228_005437 [Amoeboaphelidium protococcarum]|nr:hypothetical protein MP228_005437 [Amoeboaphelidium protococcarum]